ncbi:hypothetical protein P153DRAFT_371531 [Dothidotthia symphoricarpi CBS 119687]|uniref:Uncharacterized protein n=1 Tax=Dothidotthia symphoricarpi CBS 119687 TaxID=1392245 RepID=A0A6A5ZWE4_9PLEO|nr:uncharacterized protein P153DRAFT_371531 [Dothidotthia symphoricarpi CBS 119687]KAF2123616.1 hypothetical protein P153DRAFT_371531 [Dothidotthia symphoricarpi CBS 119687]
MWLGLYRYMGKLGNQTKTNEIRQLIIRLTMRTVFRSLKPPRKGGKRSKTAPHLSDADLGRFCDDYFGFLVDDETAQGKAILKWIRHESRLANAYGVLADELGSVGRGTLVYMVANGWITHHQLGYGLALDTVVGKAGLAHLESLKLYEMKSVRDWEKRVERWCEKLLPALTGNEQQS